jgi:hypothetical protein
MRKYVIVGDKMYGIVTDLAKNMCNVWPIGGPTTEYDLFDDDGECIVGGLIARMTGTDGYRISRAQHLKYTDNSARGFEHKLVDAIGKAIIAKFLEGQKVTAEMLRPMKGFVDPFCVLYRYAIGAIFVQNMIIAKDYRGQFFFQQFTTKYDAVIKNTAEVRQFRDVAGMQKHVSYILRTRCANRNAAPYAFLVPHLEPDIETIDAFIEKETNAAAFHFQSAPKKSGVIGTVPLEIDPKWMPSVRITAAVWHRVLMQQAVHLF